MRYFDRLAALGVAVCVAGAMFAPGAATATPATAGNAASSSGEVTVPIAKAKRAKAKVVDLEPSWKSSYHFRAKTWNWKRGTIRMRLSVKGNQESSANVKRKTCRHATKCRVTIGPTVSKDRGSRLKIRIVVRGRGGKIDAVGHKSI